MTLQNDNLAIGLDIGGTETKAVVITAEGEVLAQGSEPTALPAHRDKASISARLKERVEHLRAAVGQPIDHIGLAVPGMASRDERVAQWLPADKLDLQDVDFAKLFAVPAAPTMNDAHAALRGEVWRGAAAGKRDVVMLTLGTGVGGAILADGRLVRGTMGRAGHLGHIGLGTGAPPSVCDMPGSLEQSVGNVSLPRRSGGRFTRTQDLLAAVDAGDEEAEKIWDTSVRDLAYAISSFINMLDPELIVISGGIAKAGNQLFGRLAKHLAPIEWKPTGTSVPVAAATLGEWAGAIGAASRALNITA